MDRKDLYSEAGWVVSSDTKHSKDSQATTPAASHTQVHKYSLRLSPKFTVQIRRLRRR